MHEQTVKIEIALLFTLVPRRSFSSDLYNSLVTYEIKEATIRQNELKS